MKATTDCPNCRKLEAKVRRREAQLAKLEAELRNSKRQATPFSRDTKKSEPQKPGRKKGQGTFSYRPPPPEENTETVHVPLETCPDC
ncbi:MAG: IS66 family transposase, partial [Phycisphaerae bacterium]